MHDDEEEQDWPALLFFVQYVSYEYLLYSVAGSQIFLQVGVPYLLYSSDPASHALQVYCCTPYIPEFVLLEL